jgi:outer membrane murein-binding lipoprotein Lpp
MLNRLERKVLMDFGANVRKVTLGAIAISSFLLAGGRATAQAQTTTAKQPNM